MHSEKALRGRNEWWRYLLTLVMVFLSTEIIGSFPIIFALFQKGVRDFQSAGLETLMEQAGISQNFSLVLTMFPVVVAFFTLDYLIPRVHERSFTDTVTGAPRFRTDHFLKAFTLWFLLSLLALGADYLLYPEYFVNNFQPGRFAVLLLISIVLIPLQTGFEEYMFRGYLFQGLTLWLKNKWLAMLVVSLLFAWLHLSNPEVEYFGEGVSMGMYMLWALFFGFVTLADDGLEAVWGVHTANNLFAALFVTYPHSALQTPAILLLTEINGPESLVSQAVMILLFLVIAWKVFGWKRKGR